MFTPERFRYFLAAPASHSAFELLAHNPLWESRQTNSKCLPQNKRYKDHWARMAPSDLDNSAGAYEQFQRIDNSRDKNATSESNGEEFKGAVVGGNTVADVSAKTRDLTSQILDFLSNASNETQGACIVALGATTWLILGRVGLVLIGVVAGVVLHATWEKGEQGHTNNESNALEARRRREKGLDIVGRVLDWRQKPEDEEKANGFEIRFQRTLDFSKFRPETSAALTGLTDAVIRDYVKWWYGPLLPTDESFPSACRQTLTGFLLALSSHLSRKRPADTFLDFLTNSSSIVIVFLSELSSAIKAVGSSSDVSDAVPVFLEANPSSSLASILDIQQQNKKLRAVADDILHTFVEPKAYACEPVRLFLREILAGVILEMTVRSCSRPEFINEWIIYSLEEGNPELLEAFDVGVGGATSNGNVRQSDQVESSEASTGGIKSTDSSAAASQYSNEHKRTVSRAEDAMEEAMQEAKRLSELIAAEEAKKEPAFLSEESATAEATPTWSRDDLSAILDDPPQHETEDHEIIAETKSSVSKSTPSLTTFDQIISSQQPTALQNTIPYTVPPLTLYNASVSILDDSVPGEKGSIRLKPTAEYLLQIEPATSQYPGWMIARKYFDFETLHEVLRRISIVSGVAAFAEKHQKVPAWKNQTKAKLRNDLEYYLRDALSFQRLAESEGMKRFLEKDQHLGRSSPSTSKGGFGFPSPAALETMGKGMLDVLASAPKGAAGGGKAILGGVTGVLGGVGSIGQNRQSTRDPTPKAQNFLGTDSANASKSALPPLDSNMSGRSSFAWGRDSQESPRPSLETPENSRPPPLPRRQSHAASLGDSSLSLKSNGYPIESQEGPVPKDIASAPAPTPKNELHLPPPPSEISDDYNISQDSQTTPPRKSTSSSILPSEVEASTPPRSTKPEAAPLNSQETSVAVELFFAIINELYNLSSAWSLRLTLLNAAKSFLLRPGNPNLEAIRVLLQSTVIDANTTDAGIATHLLKLRENAMPTEEEIKAWPLPPSDEERKRRRVKARELLVEKGMPQALMSVMGAAASGEALGRVFDCLQVSEVARGLIFALILQGVRAFTQ